MTELASIQQSTSLERIGSYRMRERKHLLAVHLMEALCLENPKDQKKNHQKQKSNNNKEKGK